MTSQIQVKFDEIAAEYEAKYEHPSSILHLEKIRRLQLLEECAQLLKPTSALDAGCGNGIGLANLSGRLPGTKLAGADLSFLMLQQARRNQIDAGSLTQALVEHLPFAKNSFDLIFALGVIDYLEKPAQFFETVRRLLEPGGYFIFTYPNRDSINRMLLFSMRICFGRYFHRREAVVSTPLKSSMVDRLLSDCGFELIQRHAITYGNGLFYFPWSSIMTRTMEKWWDKNSLSRYLAWSCFCVARNSESQQRT